MEDGASAKVWTKLLRLSREEERDKPKDDGWNAAPGSDANWSSLVNNAAENGSKYFSLLSVVGNDEALGSSVMTESEDGASRQLKEAVTLSRENKSEGEQTLIPGPGST